jgi:hypothetical protein
MCTSLELLCERPRANKFNHRSRMGKGHLIRPLVSFITPTVGGNICPFAIPSGWPSRGSSPRLAASVTLTITPSRQIALQSPVRQCLAETINGLYKAEVIHRLGPWKTMASVEWETLKWVDWFNNRRLLEPIGYIPPAEAEERYYAQFNALDMVA